MRSRWQEWLIFVSIVAIAVAGIGALWGQDLRRLFSSHPDEEQPQKGDDGPPAPGGPF